jgi:hypothetical protein
LILAFLLYFFLRPFRGKHPNMIFQEKRTGRILRTGT